MFFSAILLYRICRCCSHLVVKLCHTFFHACSIPCIVIGFMTVWDSHNQQNIPNFYSLHSWLGLITMGLFAFQFVLGFFRYDVTKEFNYKKHDTKYWFTYSFLVLLCCDNATHKFRSIMVPIHASLGLATFMLAVAAGVTGLTQKAIMDLGLVFICFIHKLIALNSCYLFYLQHHKLFNNDWRRCHHECNWCNLNWFGYHHSICHSSYKLPSQL